MDPETLDLLRGAVQLLDEGTDPAQVDRAIREETGGRFSGFDPLADAARGAGISYDEIMAPVIADRRGINEAAALERARAAGIETRGEALPREAALAAPLALIPAARGARGAYGLARKLWPLAKKAAPWLGGGEIIRRQRRIEQTVRSLFDELEESDLE